MMKKQNHARWYGPTDMNILHVNVGPLYHLGSYHTQHELF